MCLCTILTSVIAYIQTIQCAQVRCNVRELISECEKTLRCAPQRGVNIQENKHFDMLPSGIMSVNTNTTMCAPVRYYKRDYLLRCRRVSGYPPPSVIQCLKKLKLFRNRGSRGGKSVVRPIRTVTPICRKVRQVEMREYKHVEVPRVWYSLPSLLLSNVTSLSNKMDELMVSVSSTCADIVAITEAWQIVPEVCTMQDFQLFHHLRTERRGGGVALFCRSSLSPSHLPVNVPPGVEALWVRVTPPAILATQHPSFCASHTTPQEPPQHRCSLNTSLILLML